MQVQGKVWGSTSLLFDKNNVEIHRIVGKLGGYCSLHSHENKFNMFFVESGKIKINTWMSYGLIDETVLESTQYCTVPPKVPHMFEVLEDNTIAYEIYWTELNKNDIIRENVGGMKK